MIFLKRKDILLLEFLKSKADKNCLITADDSLYSHYKSSHSNWGGLSIEEWQSSIYILTIYGLLTRVKDMTFITGE